MKKGFITLITIMTLFAGASFAYDNNIMAVNYIENAQNYFKNSEYSKAIDEYRNALRVNPNEFSARAGLINSYLKRAGYYYDKTQQYNAALNDLRSALFYLKYYTNEPQDAQISDAIKTTEANLSMIMKSINISSDPKSRLAVAKRLKATGNFSAAATEFYAATADKELAAESFEALGDIANIYKLSTMAANYYGEALKRNDNNPDLHLKMAKVLDAAGMSQAATNHYNFALTNSSESPDMINSLERIWLEKVGQNPKDAEAQANLGAIYQKQGNYQMALAQYQKAEQINPTNINTRLNMGTLYQVQKNYPMAVDAYNSILAIYPNDAYPHYYKAQCLKEMNNKQEAIKEYRTALSINKNIGTAKNELLNLMKETLTPQQLLEAIRTDSLFENKAESYYDYAYDLHTAGNLDEAVLFYKEAIAANPSYADAYVNLSQVYKQLSQYDNAKMVLAEGKQQLPSNDKIKKYYDLVESEMGNLAYEKASKLFEANDFQQAMEKFLSIKPQTPESLIGAAACCQQMEKYADALSYYKKAFVLDSKNSEIAYYIAMLSMQEGNMVEAKTFAQKALELDSKNAKANEIISSVAQNETIEKVNHAIELYESEKFDSSLAILNEVLNKDKNNANAYFYRGLVYDAKKMYTNAIADYTNAYKNNSDFAIAKYSIAVDYDNLKKYKEAYQAFKDYLSISAQNDEYAEYAKSRIDALKSYATSSTK